jgi:hypothetical protein
MSDILVGHKTNEDEKCKFLAVNVSVLGDVIR